MTKKKSARDKLHEFYGKQKPLETAKIFMDVYGINCCECPRCLHFTPNASPGKIKCQNCGKEFEAVK